LTKDDRLFILNQKLKGEEDEYLVDCQYKYFFIGSSGDYGGLSHHSIECFDSMVKKGITSLPRA